MMKPNKTFKLSKQTKRFMATFIDPIKRGEFKRAMIQAELAAAVVPKREPRKQGQQGQQFSSAYVTNDTGTASTSSE
jgi:hypothetical protein